MMTPVEAAWVAGIVEGEGCISWTGSSAKIVVKMTDYDTIQRLQDWTGVGTIREEKRPANRKRIWKWVANATDDFLMVADAIEPFLMARRGAKLRETRALLLQRRVEVAEHAAERFKFCPRGHDKDVTGRGRRGACLACAPIHQANYQARKAESNA